MTLMNNTGVTSGGGIHLSIPAIRYTTTIFNQLCFLQYKDPGNQDIPPHEWEVKHHSFVAVVLVLLSLLFLLTLFLRGPVNYILLPPLPRIPHCLLSFLHLQNVSISFIGNKAGMSGAAMFASDMQLCQWNGNDYESRGENSTYIFGDLPDEIAHLSPFHYEYESYSSTPR